MGIKNWGGNLDYQSDSIIEPKSIAELQDLIRKGPIRPIGTKHSFSPVVIGKGQLVSTLGLEINPVLDLENKTVTVAANTRFGDLAVFLEANGWALKNMGSLPHISIAGACATGTHGSGDGNQILSSSLSSFDFLDCNAELKTLKRGDDLFEAGRLGLGSYGLWVSVTLDIIPSYQVRQDVYHGVSWERFYEDPSSLTGAGYSVSLFTKWGGRAIDQLWVKNRIADRDFAPLIDGIAAEQKSKLELAPGVGDNLTQQGGIAGAWCDRLPHFRLDATPSAGNEIQTEYFVVRDQGPEAIRVLNSMAELINPILIISEIRTIKQDNAWLSPMRRGDSIALHFTWKNEGSEVNRVVAEIEKNLEPFGLIPHWGKVHGYSKKQLESVHPKLTEAKAVFDELDPLRKFSSEYLVKIGVRSDN